MIGKSVGLPKCRIGAPKVQFRGLCMAHNKYRIRAPYRASWCWLGYVLFGASAFLSWRNQCHEIYKCARIPVSTFRAKKLFNGKRRPMLDWMELRVNPKYCVNAKLWCKIEQKCFKAGAEQAAAAFSTKITALRGDVNGGGVSLRSSRLLTFRLQPVSPACGRQRTPPTVRELRSSPAAFRSTSQSSAKIKGTADIFLPSSSNFIKYIKSTFLL